MPLKSTCLLSFALLSLPALQACDTFPRHAESTTPAAAIQTTDTGHKTAVLGSDQVRVEDAAGPVTVQRVEFQVGESSATVERLARSSGCASERGAGLITEKGPVEVYRMQCDNGSVFMARCELRQCQPMR